MIGLAAVVSLFLPWPVMVIVGCIALSRYRGPNHYTKFAVPYAYRFKWDPVWIAIAVFGTFSGLVHVGRAVHRQRTGRMGVAVGQRSRSLSRCCASWSGCASASR